MNLKFFFEQRTANVQRIMKFTRSVVIENLREHLKIENVKIKITDLSLSLNAPLFSRL